MLQLHQNGWHQKVVFIFSVHGADFKTFSECFCVWLLLSGKVSFSFFFSFSFLGISNIRVINLFDATGLCRYPPENIRKPEVFREYQQKIVA